NILMTSVHSSRYLRILRTSTLVYHLSHVVCSFTDTPSTEIYTLSLHDALPISLQDALGRCVVMCHVSHLYPQGASLYFTVLAAQDRKSTRLNSSHGSISYAVFCLKKKKKPGF